MNPKKLKKKLNIDNESEIKLLPIYKEILPEMFLKYSFKEPIPSQDLIKYPLDCWRILLGHFGVFQLPTIELIDFLRFFTQNKKAIEICCGNGTIAKSLNIPATDRMISIKENSISKNIIKENESIFNKYTYNFPEYVECLTANQAIEKYKPEVVIGCWVSQKATNKTVGSIYGVEEDILLKKVKTYIHCGSSVNSAHYKKKILKIKHYTIRATWLFDRATGRGPSELKIWTDKEPCWDDMPEHLEFDIIY